MNERLNSRKQLIYYLRAFNSVTDKPIGQVVDITKKGFSIVTHRPIEEFLTIPVRIQLPQEKDGDRTVELRAICRWCRPNANSEFYRTGFEITAIDSAARVLIDWLIGSFEFSGDESIGFDIDIDQSAF